jgi:hypothetical protein
LSALEKLSSEQIAMVYSWIDPEYWQRRLKDYAADAEWCKHVLKQAGF